MSLKGFMMSGAGPVNPKLAATAEKSVARKPTRSGCDWEPGRDVVPDPLLGGTGRVDTTVDAEPLGVSAAAVPLPSGVVVGEDAVGGTDVTTGGPSSSLDD
jgi:hypothetical protein